MMAQARARNAAAIAEGRVELRQGDASRLPFPDDHFDKIFATNVIYFWEDPAVTVKELRRVLKPGGRIALYVIAKEDLVGLKVVQTGVYTLYTGEELIRVLQQAGFHRAQAEMKSERFRTGLCGLAEK
jgi:ubiquinone/menaquinone biosynthesis C-methylase UbiE